MTARKSFETPVEVALFGTPQLRLAAGKTHVLERRDAALVAYLAREGSTPRSRLLELLWPDSEPETARNTLRQRLFQLKKRAGREVVRGTEVLSLAVDVAVNTEQANATLLDGHDYSDCPSSIRGYKRKESESALLSEILWLRRPTLPSRRAGLPRRSRSPNSC